MILGIDAINIRGGGIEHIKNILNKKDLKFDQIIIWGNKEVLKNINKDNKVKKIYLDIFDKNLLIRFFWQLLFFKRSIKKNKVNCMFYLSGFFLRKITKSITFYQNILPFENIYHNQYSLIDRLKFYVQKKLFLNSAKRSDFIIFPSIYFRKKFIKYNNDIKNYSTVIYHGAKKKFNNINKIKKIKSIYPASYQKLKNHEKLFKAFYGLEKKNNISLDLFGPMSVAEKGILNKNIFKFKNLDKKIKYKGNKKYNYKFKNYNLLIYPSLCESFGLPLVEAAVSGLRIACSDIPIFREILGKYPIYFNPNSDKSIQNSLKKINKIKITKNQISSLKNKYNWKKCSKKTFKLIFNISLNEKKDKKHFINNA